jgi:cellulose synthase/poly-beta-1,6-N-acetylglucosamine synthase-like glycosyltransferase
MTTVALTWLGITGFTALLLLLYPLWAWLRKLRAPKADANAVPFEAPVSIIISCYNEAAFIRQKINSLLDPAEWIPGSELLVVSGGSTDETNAILETFRNHPHVRLFIFEERIGKINSVNLAVAASKNELLVFSDCRQQMKPGSVKKLVSRFSDPHIGTVNSTLRDAPEAKRGSLFRRLLNKVAFHESAGGSALNLYGALYAQRKSVYREIPADILFDDLFVIVSTIGQGYRLVQERDAVIYDVQFGTYYSAERIERLTRGLLLFFFRHRHLIGRMPPVLRMRFLLYKYTKLLLPVLFLPAPLAMFYLALHYFTPLFLALFIAGALLLLLIPNIRAAVFLGLRINHFMFRATFRFLFMNERSNSWQKLQVKTE